MSANSGLNVARYLALGFGVIYGITHQRKITNAAKAQALEHEYEHKQSLIEQAKEEFRKKSEPSTKDSGSVITDPSNPKYDPEAHLKALA